MPRNTFEWSTLVISISTLVISLLLSSVCYIFVIDQDRQDVLIDHIDKKVILLDKEKVDKREFDMYRKSLTR